MAINSHDTRTPAMSAPTSTHYPAPMPLRITLIALAAFVALTAIQGAIFVMPTMPMAWLHQGLIAPFADYTIPALALGVLCGGGALGALVALMLRPQLGGLVALIAGAFMIGFELVEIPVVGFTPVLYPTQPQGWLQIIYLGVGALMAALGWRLWHVGRNA